MLSEGPACMYYLHSSKYNAVRTCSEFLGWGYTEKLHSPTGLSRLPGLAGSEAASSASQGILSLKDTVERRHHATTQHSYSSTTEEHLSSKLLQKNQNCSVKYFGLLIRKENKQTPNLLQLQQSMQYNFFFFKKKKSLALSILRLQTHYSHDFLDKI